MLHLRVDLASAHRTNAGLAIKVFFEKPEHLEPVDPGHSYVRQDKRRERIPATIMKEGISAQVGDGFNSSGNTLQGKIQTGLFQGSFDKHNLVLLILDQE